MTQLLDVCCFYYNLSVEEFTLKEEFSSMRFFEERIKKVKSSGGKWMTTTALKAMMLSAASRVFDRELQALTVRGKNEIS